MALLTVATINAGSPNALSALGNRPRRCPAKTAAPGSPAVVGRLEMEGAGLRRRGRKSEAFDNCADGLTYEDDPAGLYHEESINPQMYWGLALRRPHPPFLACGPFKTRESLESETNHSPA